MKKKPFDIDFFIKKLPGKVKDTIIKSYLLEFNHYNYEEFLKKLSKAIKEHSKETS